MSAMTAAATTVSAQPPSGTPMIPMVSWLMWGALGFSVAVMAVVLGMIVTVPGRRYLVRKSRNDARQAARIVLAPAIGIVYCAAGLWVLSVVTA